MLKYFYKVIICLFIISLYSCSDNAVSPDFTGSIKGQVLDEITQAPVSGVNITTSPATNAVISDKNGVFTFTDIAVGDYTISFSKDGYEKSYVNVLVKQDQTLNPVVSLKSSIGSNVPPDLPYSPFPVNNATNIPLNVELNWAAKDKNNDSLTFDLYLYESNNSVPFKIVEGIKDTFYLLNGLKFSTTYFWQVVVKDTSLFTNGTIWSFKTTSIINNPFIFTSEEDGNFDLYSCDSTSNTSFIVLNRNGKDLAPKYNPARTKIAFTSDYTGMPYLYTMNINGDQINKISSNPVISNFNYGVGYCWSADGNHLYYCYYNHIIRIDEYGGASTIIATAPAGYQYKYVECSPKNDKLVVLLSSENYFDNILGIMDADGNNFVSIYNNPDGALNYPSFSIDQKYILFTYDNSKFEITQNRELSSSIYLYNIATKDTLNLSSYKISGTNDIYPRFSPTGSDIIFCNTPNDNSQFPSVWIMDISTKTRKLVANKGILPDWK